MEMLHERIVPIDKDLEKLYQSDLSQYFESWLEEWFGTMMSVYSGAVENITNNADDGLLIISENKPLFRLSCSVSTLIKILSGCSVGNDESTALILISKILTSLSNRLGIKKNIEVLTGSDAVKFMAKASESFSVKTSEGFIEFDFYSEVYACYLDRTYKNKTEIKEIYLEDKAEPLGSKKVSISIDIKNIKINVKKLFSLKVGDILVSKNKLVSPVEVFINNHSFSICYIGKDEHHKSIKIGGTRDDS